MTISLNSFCQKGDESYYLKKIENSTSAVEISKAIDRYNEYLSGDDNIRNSEKKKNLLNYDRISLTGDRTCGWALNKIGEYGFIGENFTWKFKLPYHSLGNLNGLDICEVRLENGMGNYYNFKTQKLLTSKEYNMTEPFSNGRALVGNHSSSLYQPYNYGFIDENGKEIIPLIYAEAWSFLAGMAWVKKDGKKGILELNGKPVVPLIYDELGHSFDQGIVGAKKDGKYGYINLEGKVVVPFEYDEVADCFTEGLGKVTKDYKSGFVNDSNQIIIPLIYDKAGVFTNGVSRVKVDDYFYLIDKTGKQLSERFDEMATFSDGLTAVSQNTKCGFVNYKGKLQIPLIYDGVESFKNGLAKVVSKEGVQEKWGIINTINQIVIPLEYNEISSYQNPNFIRVRKDEYWGIVDLEGKTLLPIIYDDLDITNSNFIRAKKNAKYGWINSDNEILIPFIYEDFYTNKGFEEKLILVQSKGKWGIISKDNAVVQNMQYDEISYLDRDTKLARVRQNSKYGYLNSMGKLVIPIVYDKADENSYKKSFEVSIGNKEYRIDMNGKTLNN